MLQIKHWLAPPVFQNDEAKTRRAVLLNAALINILTLVPVILIGNLIGGRTPLPVLGANAFAFAFCFVLFAWMRRGKVRLASIGLMIMGLVLVTASAASLGTIRAPTTAMYLLMVIMGGLLFDLGGMVTITALCSLLVGGLIGAENAGLLPRPDYSVTITQWIAYTAICGWTGSLTFSALQALRQALQRAQDEIAERQRVEHALRASEARYRLLYENSDDAILLTTPDGAILTANPAACRIFGRTEAEICQVGRAGVVDATDPRLPIALETRQRTGKFRGELTYLRRDGQPFPGEVTSVVFRDEDGQLRTSMIIRDITERKRAEQAQREAEVRYRALFEQTHDAVFILDLQGRHLATNQRAADLLGYSFEEMQKLSVGEISAELPESEAVLARLLRGEHIPVYERRFRKKNGEVVPVEINVERVCDANGNPTHIQSVARDITERKRMEKALRESEQRLQTIVETVPDGIMIMNREGRISFANDFAQRTLGLTPSALARRTYDDPRWKITTTDGKSFPREELPFARVMQTGKTALGIEHALQRPDGTRAILSVNASPWRDDSQKLVGVIASITDITERKRVEEALKESEEKLRLFIEYAPVAL
ncbi:MAG: PAS domain S-box protein, partial [Chloroflexota bacterium]